MHCLNEIDASPCIRDKEGAGSFEHMAWPRAGNLNIIIKRKLSTLVIETHKPKLLSIIVSVGEFRAYGWTITTQTPKTCRDTPFPSYLSSRSRPFLGPSRLVRWNSPSKIYHVPCNVFFESTLPVAGKKKKKKILFYRILAFSRVEANCSVGSNGIKMEFSYDCQTNTSYIWFGACI